MSDAFKSFSSLEEYAERSTREEEDNGPANDRDWTTITPYE